MAKVKINKTVEVCDFCGRDGYLQTCIRCGRRYCLTDHAIVAGCWVKPDVCRDCGGDEVVKEICRKYADLITPILKKRDSALRKPTD